MAYTEVNNPAFNLAAYWAGLSGCPGAALISCRSDVSERIRRSARRRVLDRSRLIEGTA